MAGSHGLLGSTQTTSKAQRERLQAILNGSGRRKNQYSGALSKTLPGSFGPEEFTYIRLNSSSLETKNLSANLAEYIKLTLLVVAWYICSSCSSMISKLLLNHSSFPITLSAIQFGLSSTFALAMGHFVRHQMIRRLSMSSVRKILPLSLALIISKVCFLISVESSPLSFTHTIKSSAPIFAVVLSRFLLNYRPSMTVYLSLGIICAGISLASVAELSVSVSSLALITALISTLANVISSLVSKMIFNEDPTLDSVSLSFYMSCTSMALLTPAAIYCDWDKFGTGLEQIMDGGGFSVQVVLILLVLSSLSYFCQNLVSFMVLNHLSAVTFSILGTVKRLFIIITSVIVFGNNITPMNGLGICLAVIGVGLYNRGREQEGPNPNNANNYTDRTGEQQPSHKLIVLEL